MPMARSIFSSWDTKGTQSKKGSNKGWGLLDKLGAPVHQSSNKICSQAFWPTTLDKESYKAARILRSFCTDGFYTQDAQAISSDGPKRASTGLKKIPQKVMENAVGLAIFTTLRTGLWISGAGGSGILVARQEEDGEWSPPCAITLQTAGPRFQPGVDICDRVLVINNRNALAALANNGATLGGELGAAAGPVSAVGGVHEEDDDDDTWKLADEPLFSYSKSRGFRAAAQVDGTVVIERTDENVRFYGEEIGVADILAGKTQGARAEIQVLMETLKAAEGRRDVDGAMMNELDAQLAPGDMSIDDSGAGSKTFGIPAPDDPDPFGVLALEKEGLGIVEAGTRQRASTWQFAYSPSPSSPLYASFQRRKGGLGAGANSAHVKHASFSDASLRQQKQQTSLSSDADADAQPGRQTSVPRPSDGSVEQNVEEHHGEPRRPERVHVVEEGQEDDVVNREYVGENPWRSREDLAGRDPAIELRGGLTKAAAGTSERAQMEESVPARSLVPRALPPR